MYQSMYQSFAPPSDDAPRRGRLAALRAALRTRKLHAMLVPRADEYLGSYGAAAGERLRWLSGFSGSAGCALILPQRALLFVDGRYLVQARQETEARLFAVMDIGELSLAAWLQAHWPRGKTLAYDARLHAAAQCEQLQRALAKRRGTLHALSANPLDRLWQDRPPWPATPLTIHAHRYAGEAHAKKCARLAAELRAKNLAGFFFAQPESAAWLLNIRARDVPHTPVPLSALLLQADGRATWFLAPERATPQLKRHLGSRVRLCPPAQQHAVLRALGDKPVGYDPALTPHAARAALKRPIAMADPSLLARAQKNRIEQAGLRRAHQRDGIALTRFLAWLALHPKLETLSEIAAAQKLEALRAASGHLRDLSFDTISACGPHGAIVHYRVTEASNRRFRKGEIYLVDSGAQYQDGTTDVTRTILLGGTPQPHIRAAFTRVLMGHAALAAARFPPGTSGHQLDALARRALWADGLDFAHGTGHGVGQYLCVHEGPQHISPQPSPPLRLGMVLSNEPGYYQTGQFGIRLENMMLVTQAPEPSRAPKKSSKPQLSRRPMLQFETLTLAPMDTRLIDKRVLDDASRGWLNRYHARVRREIAPALSARERQWLMRATAPL